MDKYKLAVKPIAVMLSDVFAGAGAVRTAVLQLSVLPAVHASESGSVAEMVVNELRFPHWLAIINARGVRRTKGNLP